MQFVKTILQKFLDSDPAATSLYAHDFRDPEALNKIADNLSDRKLNPVVVDILRKDNPACSDTCKKNLQLIADPNCRFVVTGQQIGIFGGPLLTLYKIASCVKLAMIFSERLSVPVVPIFWMQTEDHDLPEISSAGFLDNSENFSEFTSRCLDLSSRQSVGTINLPSGFSEEAKEFFSTLDLPALDILLDCYKDGENLAESFAKFIKRFCSESGVLFFNPLNNEVKKLAFEVIERSFSEEKQISSLLSKNLEKLKSSGFSEQVAVRPDSPLFFLEMEGQRRRLNVKSDSFFFGEQVFSKEQVKHLISNQPQKFTSSALIRPILQDFIFPNLAYVAGPSEFNYWAQTLELYQHFDLIQPLIIPRSNFRLLEAKYQKILAKSGFRLEDIQLTDSELLAKYSTQHKTASELFAFEKKISDELDLLKNIFSNLDQNLLSPLQQTQSSIHSSLARLSKRYEDSLIRKQGDSFSQLTRIRKVLMPAGAPQERVVCSAYFLLKYGKDLMDKLLEHSDPLNSFETRYINL